VLQYNHIGAVTKIIAAVEELIHFSLESFVHFDRFNEGSSILLLLLGIGVVIDITYIGLEQMGARLTYLLLLVGLRLPESRTMCRLATCVASRLLYGGLAEGALDIIGNSASAGEHLGVVGFISLENCSLFVVWLDGLAINA
jgi:hypothetical protein